jgi:arsenite methyltransferase
MSGLEFTDAAAARRLEKLYLTRDVVAQQSETLRQLAPVQGERVLDIGSGPGFLSESIAALVGAEGMVVGIDISADLVAMCERRNPPKWLSFEVGDATKMDMPNASFDAVVWTPTPSPALSALLAGYRVRRSAGYYCE